MIDLVALVVGTALAVGSSIAAVAVWAFKAVIAKDVTPTLVELGSEASALTREFSAFRVLKEDERKETMAILRDLDRIVQNHETRITVIEKRGP